MHSGTHLVSGIIKAFTHDCPHLGDFLNARLVVAPHLDARLLKRKAIRKIYEEDNYGIMVADVWQDKDILCAEMFYGGTFEKRIKLQYLDVPKLHEFGPEGEKFFDLLESSTNYSLFRKTSIQLLIMFKWQKV